MPSIYPEIGRYCSKSMNGLLQLLLRLQELDLLKRGLELAHPRPPENCFESIAPKRVRVRRQIPSALLSEYDTVAQQYPDTLAAVEDGRCSACDCAPPK